MLWFNWAEEWALEDKVSFNGVEKKIYIHPLISSLSVKADIYSAWVRWLSINQNSRYLYALRYIGNDDIGGGQRSGEMYFLMNGWQIVIDHQVIIDDIIYSDTSANVFQILPGGGVTNKVASLAYSYQSGSLPEDDLMAIFNQVLDERGLFNTRVVKIDKIDDIDLTTKEINKTTKLTLNLIS